MNLGCGNKTLPGFINLDSSTLPGVDVVHNLSHFPWPFLDDSSQEIRMTHVLEHLPDTLKVVEEIWRVSKPHARIRIHVPFWNATDYITDPQHLRPFNQFSFDFYDPRKPQCRERPYYSKARFLVKSKIYTFKIGQRYYEVRNPFLKILMDIGATYFCNIIQVIEFELEAVK